ncbi:MAG: CHAT domain-containing tetratricopeptide repeat protein [Saprospiraceae bacterium]
MFRSFLFALTFLFITPLYSQNPDSLIATQRVDSLIKISNQHVSQQQFAEALIAIEQSEKIALETLGRESQAYGKCCYSHGRIYYYAAQYAEAVPWYLESLEIREKVIGKETAAYAQTQYNLAVVYNILGKKEEAIELLQETLRTREKVLGKKSQAYAWSLSSLANIYASAGSFDQAESMFLEAKSIRLELLGTEHWEYASSLGDLSKIYIQKGDFKKAEEYSLQTRDVLEKTFGKDHPNYAYSLNALGSLYETIGNLEKSCTYYEEGKAIYENVYGRESYKYAGALSNLSNIYSRLGRRAEAEAGFKESIEIRAKILGTEHPEYATSINDLGVFYYDGQEFEAARDLFEQSRAIREKVLGTDHWQYGMVMSNLGNVYSELGEQEKARACFKVALAINKRIYGEKNPEISILLNNMAAFEMRYRNYPEAETLQQQVAAIDYELLIRGIQHLSEDEMLMYLKRFIFLQRQFLTFGVVTQRDQSIDLCYDNILFYKGFLLQARQKMNRLAKQNPKSSELYKNYQSLQQQLSAEYTSSNSSQELITALEEETNRAEKEMARAVSGFDKVIQQVKWQEVKSALAPGEAAIEFVHFQNFAEHDKDTIKYVALILRPEWTHPKMIWLCDELDLKQAIESAARNKSFELNQLYQNTGEGSLYQLVWEPLEDELKGVKQIYYAPSGMLHRLNLSAIHSNEVSVMADRFDMKMLGSTRQLVLEESAKMQNNEMVLLGGLQYEPGSQVEKNTTAVDVTSSHRGNPYELPEESLRGGDWKFLPGTEQETGALSKIALSNGWNVQLLSGTSGTESAIYAMSEQQIASPRVLHFATHAFFFPDPDELAAPENEGASAFKLSQEPMLRSGLILSGANARWRGESDVPAANDGILTAFEISQMDLSNTELVVLSACETGLGAIQVNDGLYGLQRALKAAGVRYIIMSLWQVPDQQTSLLMTTFYTNWLEKKQTIPDAFHNAQKEMRDKGFFPHQWAGFILLE